MVERKQLIFQSGQIPKETAVMLRGELDKITGRGPVARLQRRSLRKEAEKFENLTIKRALETSQTLSDLDRFVWRTENTLIRASQLSKEFGELKLAEEFDQMKNRGAEEAYEDNFTHLKDRRHPLAVMLDQFLMVTEGVIPQATFPIYTNISFSSTHDMKTGEVTTSLNAETFKDQDAGPYRIATLAYNLLGLTDKLRDIPQVDDQARFAGKKRIIKRYEFEFNGTPVKVAFGFLSPALRERRTISSSKSHVIAVEAKPMRVIFAATQP